MNGLRLKQAREGANHTQESLAEMIMINKRMLTRYENGESEPGADTLARIADALGVSADYLLGLTDDPRPYGHNELTLKEKAMVSALRRGDYKALMKAVVGDE